MQSQELATLAAELRRDGFDARNLGSVGITIWQNEVGYFYPLQELDEYPQLVQRRAFDEIRNRRASNGH